MKARQLLESRDKDLKNHVLASPEPALQTASDPLPFFLFTATSSLLLGVLFLYLARRHRSALPKIDLPSQGEPVQVKVFKIQYRTDIKIDGHHAWVIHTIPIDCTGPSKEKFFSEPLTYDPSYFLGLNDPMMVYINPKNPSHYYLDTRDIRNRKRPSAKNAA